MNYYYAYCDKDVYYSCDMLRLNFYIPFDLSLRSRKSVNFDFLFNLSSEFGFYFQCFGPNMGASAFRYLCTFTSGACVIKLGLQHNSCRTEANKILCFLEYNPNKCDYNFLYHIYQFCYSLGNMYKSLSVFFTLSRFDLAVDLPVPREFVRLIKHGRRQYQYVYRDGAITEYLSKRSSDGFVKVYDKQKESNLAYYLTRVEITCTDFHVAFPDIYVSYQPEFVFETENLTDTDRIIIEFFNRLDAVEFNSWYRRLPRGKKDKLKDYIKLKKNTFEFSQVACSCVFDKIKELMNGDFKIGEQSANAAEQYCSTVKQSAKIAYQKIDFVDADEGELPWK